MSQLTPTNRWQFWIDRGALLLMSSLDDLMEKFSFTNSSRKTPDGMMMPRFRGFAIYSN